MSSVLLPLAVLACPVSMVVMMLMMGKSHNGNDTPPDGLTILKQRYAKDEISEEQYEHVKQKLIADKEGVKP